MEKARGKQIGRKLLEQVEDKLRARGCAVIFSDVWRDAEDFYRHLGWSPPEVVLLRKKL